MTKKNEVAIFDKAALFAALKPKRVGHEVEGFGKVWFRQLALGEVDAIREEIKKERKDKASEDGPDKFGLRLVVMSMVDAQGACVLSDEDIPELEQSGAASIDALVGKALEVNGFTKPRDDSEKKNEQQP